MRYLREGVTMVAKRMLLLNLLYKRWSERSNNSDDTCNNSLQQSESTPTLSSHIGADHTDPNTLSEPLAREYEVFMSFRGSDTRYGITDTLYRFLCQLKIHTFIDESELRRGEVIWDNLARGIDQSKVYVAIFSKNYASSKWCLKELTEMVRRQKEDNRRIIFPIFYQVNPRDVRHQTGPYKKAFKQHEKNFDQKTIQDWKSALIEVGNLKGCTVKSENQQGEKADYVANLIWSHLRKNNDTLQTDELVGTDIHVEEVVKRLSLYAQTVEMVGLHGMGGIGKTTVAKAVYNMISTRFDRCSFLENIRDTQQGSDGNLKIQKKLIYDAMRRDECVLDVNSGRRIIKDRVSQFKILVVLDDVDEKLNFEEIFGNSQNFACGSRFIVTSRDSKALNSLNECRCKLYEVQGMSLPLSLQLFSKHAFKSNFPPLDYAALSNAIVSVLGGLPLTLKVVGSLLYREDDKDLWKEKLVELKEIPPKQVIDRLRISYDALEYEAKQIFLDIACLYINIDKQKPFYMWRDCNFYPANNTNLLIQRSILKIGEDGMFQMHDQIRDMGREIVRMENVEHSWKRSRIWSNDNALEMLLEKKGSDKVKAISVSPERDSDRELKSKYFVNLSELRYFEATNANLSGDFANLLPNLRWYQMNLGRWDLQSMNNLPMDKLVILDFCLSQVGNNWGGWTQIKKAKKLKVLDLHLCKNLTKLPELPESGSLEMLELTGFEGGPEEDLDISKLMNVTALYLSKASIRNIIGGTIGMIEELRELDVSYCECLNLPQVLHDVGKLQSLRILKTNSANWTQGPSADQVLTGRLPTSLKELATSSPISNLSELMELEHLKVANSGCGLEIPPTTEDNNDNEWWKSSKLKALTLRNATKMWSINTNNALLPSSLTCLDFDRCARLEWLPNLENLENLRELTFSRCPMPPEIPGLRGLKSLQTLQISYASNLHGLDGLSNLPALTRLILFECDALAKISFSSNHAEAEQLQESTLLTELYKIEIKYCLRLTEIQGIGELTSLQYLCIGDASSLTRIDGIGNLLSSSSNNLLRLRIFECPLLRNLSLTQDDDVRCECSLQQLIIQGSTSLLRDGLQMPHLSKFPMLRVLSLMDLTIKVPIEQPAGGRVEEEEVLPLQGLECLEELEKLELANLPSIERLPSLSKLGKLRKLSIVDMPTLQEIEGFADLKSLQILDLIGCTLLKNVPVDKLLPQLEGIDIRGCDNLASRSIGTKERMETLCGWMDL